MLKYRILVIRSHMTCNIHYKSALFQRSVVMLHVHLFMTLLHDQTLSTTTTCTSVHSAESSFYATLIYFDWLKLVTSLTTTNHSDLQCDQIGRFIGLWAPF